MSRRFPDLADPPNGRRWLPVVHILVTYPRDIDPYQSIACRGNLNEEHHSSNSQIAGQLVSAMVNT